MARAMRIEFPGALYHVTSRGDRREAIFADDEDRQCLLAIIEQAMDRFDAAVMAFCLMGNHYHFVLHTRQGNLSRVMRHVNAKYSQAFNRRHGLVGHLFQSRFKAILVDRDAYLMELCRYVELNPVRARMVSKPADWAWSSYRAHVGIDVAPIWLDTDGLHGYLLGRDVQTLEERRFAEGQYKALVSEGSAADFWRCTLRQQIYLGDEAFVKSVQQRIEPARLAAIEIPQEQRRKPVELAQWLAMCATREEALRRAHLEGGMSMSAIAKALNLSVSRISRLIARFEGSGAQQ